jgi:hypothetical protein
MINIPVTYVTGRFVRISVWSIIDTIGSSFVHMGTGSGLIGYSKGSVYIILDILLSIRTWFRIWWRVNVNIQIDLGAVPLSQPHLGKFFSLAVIFLPPTFSPFRRCLFIILYNSVVTR